MAYKILVVDDDRDVRIPVRRYLESSGFEVVEADSAAAGTAAFHREVPDAVLLDFALPDGDALEVLSPFKTSAPGVPVIILTGHGTIERAVQSVKEGAEDFLTKPVDLEALRLVLERSLRKSGRGAAANGRGIDPFVGSSGAIRELAREADLAVRTDSPTLIQGETGSGKGVLARWLHAHGARAGGPLVNLNCGGLSKELLESELFGHARGAFTGAVQDKPGLIELAEGGCLFLDEIGDVNPEVQPKLLTVLEDRTYRRLGEVKERRVDLRLIAATNRDLGEEVRRQRFRPDLYFRISTMVLPVPPLRDRREDIPELVEVVLRDLCGGTAPEVTAAAGEALSRYDWPGNFRELRSVLERALLASRDRTIDLAHLRFDANVTSAERESPAVSLADLERRHIQAALRAERGHVTRTASRLGIARSSFYEKIKALGIDPDEFR